MWKYMKMMAVMTKMTLIRFKVMYMYVKGNMCQNIILKDYIVGYTENSK